MPQSIINKLCERFRREYVKGHGPITNGHHEMMEAESWIEAEPEELEAFLRQSLLDLLEEVEKSLPKRIDVDCREAYGHNDCLSQVKDLLNKMKQDGKL